MSGSLYRAQKYSDICHELCLGQAWHQRLFASARLSSATAGQPYSVVARPAQVRQVSKAYLYAHHQLLDEFRNGTHWPKHLLVQYAWQVEQEVDALSGLYVVFAVCEPR